MLIYLLPLFTTIVLTPLGPIVNCAKSVQVIKRDIAFEQLLFLFCFDVCGLLYGI